MITFTLVDAKSLTLYIFFFSSKTVRERSQFSTSQIFNILQGSIKAYIVQDTQQRPAIFFLFSEGFDIF